MKKILFLLLLLTSFFVSFGQGPNFPNFQQQSSPTTRLQFLGGVQSIKGFINGRYADTATANLDYIDANPGAQIVVGNTLYLRNSTATAWISVSTGGSGVGPITTVEIINSTSWLVCYEDGSCDTVTVTGGSAGSNPVTNITILGPTTWVICYEDLSCDTITVAGDGNYWSLRGNAAVPGASAGSFLGTTNNTSLRIRTNDIQRVIIDTNGRVGIGTNAPTKTLSIQERLWLYQNGGDQSIVEAVSGNRLMLHGGADVSIIPNIFTTTGYFEFVQPVDLNQTYMSMISTGATENARIGLGLRKAEFKGIRDSTNIDLQSSTKAAVRIIQSRFSQAIGANIASANTLTFGYDGNFFTITGSLEINNITTFAWQGGTIIYLKFSGSPLVTDNTPGGAGTSPIQLVGNTDFSPSPGDILVLHYDGTDWTEIGRFLSGASITDAYINIVGYQDSCFVITRAGGTSDTVCFSGGGSTSLENANVGAGYRLLKPATQEIKTIFAGTGITIDSTTNANGITITASAGTLTTLTATDANGFDFTITNPTTTPNISLTTTVADRRVIWSNSGALAGDGDFVYDANGVLIVGGTGTVPGGVKLHVLNGGNISMGVATSGFYRSIKMNSWNILGVPTHTSGTTWALGGFVASEWTAGRIYTDGTERMLFSAAEVVINDVSGDVDFRYESNNSTHLIFADAGIDKVGINTSSPDSTLTIAGGLRINNGAAQNNYVWTSTGTDGRGTWMPASGSGGGFTTADNGLTASTATNVQLGSTTNSGSPLLHHTWINTDVYTLHVEGTAGPTLQVNNTAGNTAGYFSSTGGVSLLAELGTVGINASGSTYGVAAGSNTGLPLWITSTDAGTNNIKQMVNIQRSSSGSVTNNFGAAIDFTLENSGSSDVSARIISKLTNATDPTVVSQLEFWGVNSGTLAKKASIAGSGKWTWDTYGAGTHTGTPAYNLQVDASGNVIEGSIAGGSYVFQSGLTESPAGTVELGGTLLASEVISTTASFFLTVTGANTTRTLFAENTSSGRGLDAVSSSGDAILATSSSGIGINASSTSNIAAHLTTNPTSTGSFTEIARFQRSSSNTAGNGMGGYASFYLESNTGTNQEAARIGAVLIDATNASLAAELQFWTTHNSSGSQKAVLTNMGVFGIGKYSSLTGSRLEVVDDAIAGGSIARFTSTSTAATGNTQKVIEVALSGANANSSETTFGVHSSNIHTGTSALNIGVYGTVTNGSSASAGVWGQAAASQYGVRGTTVGGAGVLAEATSTGTGIQATSVSGIAGGFSVNPSSTNTIVETVQVLRTTSGTPANGIGGSVTFASESSTNASVITAQIASTLTDVTNATRTGDLQFFTVNSTTLGLKAGITGNGRFYVSDGGNLIVGGTTAAASATNTVHIYNGTIPSGSITNGVLLYSEDVAASAELKARDEAGNVVTLSPHNFTGIDGGRSEDMAWSYYSERDGKYINVDMLKLARLLEKLTGEKLVYTGDLKNKPNPKNK